MATLEIRREVDRFVLYFDTPRKEISAYALATALVGLADAVREANSIVNPGYVVEVVVEALSDGSFKATVRTIFTKAKNLFSHQAVQAVIWGIVATHIYEKAIKTEAPPNITVTDTLVIIEIGNEKIIVPKDVYEAKKQVERSERFKNALGKVFDAAASDPNVEGIAIVDDTGPQRPPLIVPREKFALFQTEQPVDESTVSVRRPHLPLTRQAWAAF